MKLKYLFLVAFLSISTISCENSDDFIPEVYVNFSVDIKDPQFLDLQAVGNSILVNGGYHGIILYRKSYNEFLDSLHLQE